MKAADGVDAIPFHFRRSSHYYQNIDAVSCGYRTIADLYYYYYYYILLIVLLVVWFGQCHLNTADAQLPLPLGH